MNAMTQRATYWFHRVLMTVLVVLVVACTIAIGREVLAPASSSPVEPTDVPGSGHGNSLGETGHVPEDTTIFDDSLPGIANLDRDVLAALGVGGRARAGGYDPFLAARWRGLKIEKFYVWFGKPLWKKDFGVLDAGYFIAPDAQWGFASSPVLHEDKVIVLADVQKDSKAK